MIGYYVHHHGRGHLARATSICARLHSPVTVLSSIAMPDGVCHDQVHLPRDNDGSTWADPTANGALHWAPLKHDDFRERMRMITEWVATAKPNVMVVDVSVEVAVLVRLLGVPTVVVAMPGDRTDAPHDLVYRMADHIVAAWPETLYEPTWLRPHSAKTTYVGGISRFGGRVVPPVSSDDRLRVLILSGTGGSDVNMTTLADCAAAHPRFDWTALGLPGGSWAEDPWPALCAADVVISSAGQSSIADIAAAARPAIVVAAQRPFAEQRATAGALERSGLAVVRYGLPHVDEWPSLIERALARGADPWQRWETHEAASRAADAIERVASSHAVAGAS